MQHTHQQRLIALALLSLPMAVLAADAREEMVPRNTGVAVEPAHRAQVISLTNRSFSLDPTKIVWVVTEPAKTRVLLPAEEKALLAARQAEIDEAAEDASGNEDSTSGVLPSLASGHVPDATVYFPFASSHVIDAAPIYSLLPKVAGGRVRLDGYTDQVGSDKYNLGLSLRRASTVSKLFLGSGVSADLIEIAGHGAADPVDPADAAKNRRVEIRLTGGAAK